MDQTPEQTPTKAASNPREDKMARTFSAELSSTFNLGGELPSLAQTIESKKHDILQQRHELHEIEAKLEATEEELARRNTDGAPTTTGAVGGVDDSTSAHSGGRAGGNVIDSINASRS